ncbi:MAG: DUF348 domain-containing protein [Chloroflexi bacterium]|nr:MAG: DUF348 domain-containing protein [Chloroflexota bacterium]
MYSVFYGYALKTAGVPTAPEDTIEPALDTELVATDYTVNIYRARPVIVTDGMVRQKIMTAAQTPSDIVANADVPELRDEDQTVLAANGDIAVDGASTVLTINRATEFTLQLYGKPTIAYTHEKTVGQMLSQKGITLTSSDSVSVDQNTPITAGMTVALWREGVQTATVEEPIAFTSRQVLDTDQPIGYKAIQTPGQNGRKNVTYEIIASNGRETGRKSIQSVVIEQPKEQIEVVGAKPGNGLTKSKGAQQFVDSKGVTHRETYYDLPMNIVMGACGGGTYTIRAADGAKIDKDGYILVAANLGNYPKCSIVETSMGPGKVYDTGGFAVRHPHGFDLATDWTNNDGR